MRKAYTLLLYLALPAVLGFLAWRGLRDRGWWRRWRERLGFSDYPASGGGILIHAASLGEVNAAAPLVSALLRDQPKTPLTLTTFTPTGSRRVRALFGKRVHHVYAPLDLPGAVRRFLRRQRPRLVIIMETEIWPNLFHVVGREGVPLMMANARLSEASLRGYARVSRLVSETLAGVRWVGAQSVQDAERLLSCGAPKEGTKVTGNLKFDLEVAATLATEAQSLRARWGADRPVLTAGSTRPGDEEVLIAAFLSIRVQSPGALLIIAPRHPERFEETARRAGAGGLRVARRSQDAACPADADCFVIDTMGELMRYYACGDVTFVGGTFADVGGHNLLEPAALGKPVLFGPHTYNTDDVANALEESGGGKRLASGEELVAAVLEWFNNEDSRRGAGKAALEVAESGRGALALTLQAVRKVIDRT
jgi:3-deoxy-D-manno-octulosonic-acid transferase